MDLGVEASESFSSEKNMNRPIGALEIMQK